MMVPPRTEPANKSGNPNTTMRATEFMLRWKTWAIGGVLRSERGGGPARAAETREPTQNSTKINSDNLVHRSAVVAAMPETVIPPRA